MFSEAQQVSARMLDFVGRRTPWHRRLWGPGMIHCLREAAELAELTLVTRQGEEQNVNYRRFLAHEVGEDYGIRSPQKHQLQQLLPRKSFAAAEIRELQHLTAQVEGAYLDNWVKYLSNGGKVPVERLARALAGMLLDHGFSPSGLHSWLTGVIKSERINDVGSLLGEVERRWRLPMRKWRVVVPVQQIPLRRHPPPGNYLDGHTASQLLKPYPDRLGIRVNGALEYELDALDAPAAVGRAAALVRRISARVVVGLPSEDSPVVGRVAWVQRCDVPSETGWWPLREAQRSVEVGTLWRNRLVFTISPESSSFDEALELLSSVETGSPGAAIAGAWATVESLLTGGDERGGDVAARRLAAIVAASIPRAELTPLAHTYEQDHSDELADDIRQCATNLEKSRRLEQAMRLDDVHFGDPSDEAAAARVRAFVLEPASLERARVYLLQAFLRLYRMRNRVMHGGTLADSAVTGAVIGTVPALVGAGVDRIAHGLLSAKPSTGPLELATRAEVNLQQALRGEFPVLAHLLEPFG